jgi:hypothetical protein
MEDAKDLVRKEEKRKRVNQRRKRKYDELLSHRQQLAPWEDNEEDDNEGPEQWVGEARREVS